MKRYWYVLLVVVVLVVIGVGLYYWLGAQQKPSGRLEFNVDSITVYAGDSASVWLSYKPVEGYAGSVTVHLSSNSQYITVTPDTVVLDSGESALINILVSSSIAPGTYKVFAEADNGITAVLIVNVVGGVSGGTEATTLQVVGLPVAWSVESGQLLQVYQQVPDPYPYSNLVYRGLISLGSTIKVYVKLQPVDGDYWVGDLKIEITKDMVLLPDSPAYTYIAHNVYIDGRGWVEIPGLEWSPPSPTGVDPWCYVPPYGCVRQYYFKIWYWKDGEWVKLYDPENILDPSSPDTRPAIYVQG